MNLDNKNGTCCNCPGLMDYSRDITQWKSARVHEIELMNKLNINNCIDYKNILQNNGEMIIKNTIDDYNRKYRCQRGDNLYLDASNFHDYFDNKDNIKTNKNNITINEFTLNEIP